MLSLLIYFFQSAIETVKMPFATWLALNSLKVSYNAETDVVVGQMRLDTRDLRDTNSPTTEEIIEHYKSRGL